MDRFRNKQTGESYYIEFDFSSVSSALIISSATVSAKIVSTGVDVTATITTFAKQLITSPVVYVWVTGGTDGVDYQITCKATASNGAVYELEGYMLVSDTPSTISRLRNKQTGESYHVEFDFSSISASLIISSAEVTVKKVSDGTDVTATLTTAAKQLVTSPVVYVWVTGGTDGEDYEITCKATASNTAVYKSHGLMLVTDIPETADAVGPSTAKTFLEQMVDDLAVFFDVTGGFAQNAVYTPAGGAAATIPVIFDRDEIPEMGMESARLYCEAKTTDVSAAKPGDTLVIDSVTYKILNPPRHSASGISEIDLTID